MDNLIINKSKVITIGGFKYLVEVKNGINVKDHLIVNVFVDGVLHHEDYVKFDQDQVDFVEKLIDSVEAELKMYTPRDKLMFFIENGVTHSLGVAYTKKPGSIYVNLTYYYDYEEIQYNTFNYYPANAKEYMIELKKKAMKRLEFIRLNYLKNPEEYYEIYNINGFGFEIGLRLEYLDNGYYDAVYMLDSHTIGNGMIKTNLIYGIEQIMDSIKSQLYPMCPADVDTIYTVGDDINVKVSIKFVKEASAHSVRITAFLDNMVYTVNTKLEFEYRDPNKMLEAKKNILDDIKGFLDTFPKSTKDIFQVKDCQYLVGKDVYKKAGSNVFKMQMKLDNEKYGNLKEYKYSLDNIRKVCDEMMNESKALYNKLKSDTPNDIISEYNKNEMDFTVYAHFTKKPGDNDIKIEYKIQNNKK